MTIIDRWFRSRKAPEGQISALESRVAEARAILRQLLSPGPSQSSYSFSRLSSLIDAVAADGMAAVPFLLEVLEARPAQIAAGDVERGYAAASAAEALGKLRYSGAAPLIVPLLADPNDLTRKAAAEALGKLRSQEAVPGLKRCLQDHDEFTRLAVVDALAAIGDQSVVRDLEPLLEDRSNLVRQAVANALGKLQWRPQTNGLRAAASVAEGDVQTAIAIGPSALPALLSQLSTYFRARGKKGHESGRSWQLIMSEMNAKDLPDSSPITSILDAIRSILSVRDVSASDSDLAALASLSDIRVMHYGPVYYYNEGSGTEGEEYKRHEQVLYTRDIRERAAALRRGHEA